MWMCETERRPRRALRDAREHVGRRACAYGGRRRRGASAGAQARARRRRGTSARRRPGGASMPSCSTSSVNRPRAATETTSSPRRARVRQLRARRAARLRRRPRSRGARSSRAARPRQTATSTSRRRRPSRSIAMSLQRRRPPSAAVPVGAAEPGGGSRAGGAGRARRAGGARGGGASEPPLAEELDAREARRRAAPRSRRGEYSTQWNGLSGGSVVSSARGVETMRRRRRAGRARPRPRKRSRSGRCSIVSNEQTTSKLRASSAARAGPRPGTRRSASRSAARVRDRILAHVDADHLGRRLARGSAVPYPTPQPASSTRLPAQCGSANSVALLVDGDDARRVSSGTIRSGYATAETYPGPSWIGSGVWPLQAAVDVLLPATIVPLSPSARARSHSLTRIGAGLRDDRR